jgi:hypothetical protein
MAASRANSRSGIRPVVIEGMMRVSLPDDADLEAGDFLKPLPPALEALLVGE